MPKQKAFAALQRDLAVLKQKVHDWRISGDQALELRTVALDNRLDKLHENQCRSFKERENFMAKDIFELRLRDFDAWREKVNNTMSVASGRDKGVSLSWSIALAIGMGCIAVGALLTRLLK